MPGPQSGIAIDDSCNTEYLAMKSGKRTKFLMLGVDDPVRPTRVEMKTRQEWPAEILKSGRSDTYFTALAASADEFKKSRQAIIADLKELLPVNECKWVVVDFPVKADAAATTKLILVKWNAPESKPKDKMVFASATSALVGKLDTGIKQICFDGHDDVTLEAFEEFDKK